MYQLCDSMSLYIIPLEGHYNMDSIDLALEIVLAENSY